jgi:hypothetical protein
MRRERSAKVLRLVNQGRNVFRKRSDGHNIRMTKNLKKSGSALLQC